MNNSSIAEEIQNIILSRKKPTSVKSNNIEEDVYVKSRFEINKTVGTISYIDDYEVISRIISLDSSKVSDLSLDLVDGWKLDKGNIVYFANPEDKEIQAEPSIKVGYETQVMGIFPSEIIATNTMVSDKNSSLYYTLESGKSGQFATLTISNSRNPDFVRQYIYSFESNSFTLRYPDPPDSHLWLITAILLYIAGIVIFYSLIKSAMALSGDVTPF